MQRRRTLVPALVVLAGLAVEPAAGLAASQVRLGPAMGASGTRVILEGTGFPKGKLVRVGVSGHRPQRVRATPAGTYRAGVTVPARRNGWVTIVSRSARTRVVNRYFATGPAAARTLVVEFASPRGRLRVTSIQLVPGATLQLRGMGFAPGRPLRISWAGVRQTVRPDRRRRFAAGIVVPAGAAPGSYPLRLVGRRVRIAFRLDVAAPPPPPPPAPPPPPPPPAPPAPAPPPTTGLVALWHMDETSGTVMQDAVGGHHGTLHSVAAGAPGFLGTAFGFNGTGWVSVPSAAALNPGTSDITITIRLNATRVPATPDWDLIRKGLFTTAGGEFKVEYQPTGQASCGFVGSGGTRELIAGPALNDGAWHTVQCVKTVSAILLVVDGQPFSMAGAVGSISNNADLVIGARPASEFFIGRLDEASVRIG